MRKARTVAKKFDPKVIEIVQGTDRTTLMHFGAHDRPPVADEPGKDWNVVWLGDGKRTCDCSTTQSSKADFCTANHAVSPYAGDGANMAIMNGWDLAESLSHAASLDAALAAYDKNSVPRAKDTLTASTWAIDVAHATGA